MTHLNKCEEKGDEQYYQRRKMPEWSMLLQTAMKTQRRQARQIMTRMSLAVVLAGMLGFQAPKHFRVDVETTNITFSVRDKQGSFVDSLRQKDFEIREDSRKQEILSFSRAADLPLTLGLILDRSGSQRSHFRDHRDVVMDFLANTLRSADSLFVAIFQNQVRLLSDFSSSRSKVAEDLDLLESEIFAGIHESLTPLGPPGSLQGGSAVFDAVYYSCRKMRPLAGRKALLLFSDGIDNASRTSLEDAIRAAQEADTILFVLFQASLLHLPSVEVAQNLLYDNNRLAVETGGELIEGTSAKMKSALSLISTQLRSMYEVSYISNNPTKAAGFRKIEIKVKNKDLNVKARKGYWRSPIKPVG